MIENIHFIYTRKSGVSALLHVWLDLRAPTTTNVVTLLLFAVVCTSMHAYRAQIDRLIDRSIDTYLSRLVCS
jgi:hypothetical protein